MVWLKAFFLRERLQWAMPPSLKHQASCCFHRNTAVETEAMRLIISLETPGDAGTFLTVASIFHISEAVPEIANS